MADTGHYRASAFASFLLIGFLEIGQEMYVYLSSHQKSFDSIIMIDKISENPFNYDLNDLGEYSRAHLVFMGQPFTPHN